MKTRLFENVGGNRFKLLKESVNVNESLVASGIKKVFMNSGGDISFKRIETVGMEYIKDITTAKQVALQEARILAKEYGYKEDEDQAKFVKENDFSKLDAQNPSHVQAKVASNEPASDETDMGNPEEKEEVKLANEILNCLSVIYTNNPELVPDSDENDIQINLKKIEKAARQLLKIHGKQ